MLRPATVGSLFTGRVLNPDGTPYQQEARVEVRGLWKVQCHNPDGSMAWEEAFKNAVVTAALNDILSVYFASGTQKPSWFFGLVDNVGFSSFNSADTMASHAGWTENTAYTSGTRVAWTPSGSSGGSIINPTPATVTMNAGAVIHGAFLASDNTKGGATGTLWATGAFSGNQTLTNGQVLSLQLQVPLTAV